ncbi:septum formation family protein [Mycobacterium sp. NPDC048908]|uniref:septum formation family protein n=1 Tax=Mycobacterium sp. NPDC048908 TaxID=3364292 RepID=UPI00371F4E38
MSVRQRWPDEVSTELVPVRPAREPVDESRVDIPLWAIKLLLVVVAIGVVVVSVAVVLQMMDRSATRPAAAHSGDCLSWPPGEPKRAVRVNCSDEHLFEVVESQALPTDSGDSAAETRQQQACVQAVEHNLGSRYDPHGRFVVGAVRTSDELMCGLQLPSNGVASVPFSGRVIDQDQSSVWPTSTCLGIRDGDTTNVAVECGLPHALEITGTVDLSPIFGQLAPSIAAQDPVVRDACIAATSAYLGPVPLETTGLSVRYQPIDATGWAAGSRKIACGIGVPKAGGGWATLVRSARDGVVIDGRRGAAVPGSAPEAPAPASEAPQPPAVVEVPVPVDREADNPTDVAEPVPHMPAAETPTPVPHLDGAQAPGPIPHMAGPTAPGPVPHMAGPTAPGPAPGSPPAERLPSTVSP